MKTIVGRLSLIVIGIAAISCVSKADLDEIKATQKQITAAQKQMLTKLEAIAKRPAAAAAKPQRPRGRLGGRYDGDFLEMAAVLHEEREFPFSYQHDLDVQKSVLLGSGIKLT